MKLKKIASLMLAGIMAVSMLAACGEGKKDDSSSSSSESTTASGYSAMLADELKDLADEDYIDFKDSESDQKALKYAVSGLANKDISASAIAGAGNVFAGSLYYLDEDNAVAETFVGKADVDDYVDGGNLFSGITKMNGTAKTGIVYVVDASVGMDYVMKGIADDLETRMTNGMVESDYLNANSKIEFDYNYVVSVSVETVKNNYDLQSNFSTNFITVTVTRTEA